MENYIIRIYRRDARQRSRLGGVVETVPQGSQSAFHDMATLWQWRPAHLHGSSRLGDAST